MTLSVNTVLDCYAAILSGKVSYEQADQWAWQWIEALEVADIHYQPPRDEVLIWDLITYLVGLNLPGVGNKEHPLTTDLDLLRFLKGKGLTVTGLT